MIRFLRIVGFLMIAAGAIVLLTWVIKPLRIIWPWIRAMPLPIQVGVGVAAGGFILLLGSLIWERLEEREDDKSLRDE